MLGKLCIFGGVVNAGFVIQNIVVGHYWIGTIFSLVSGIFSFAVGMWLLHEEI